MTKNMHYLNDLGFVIRRVNVGEADKYLTVFTKHHGKIELIAKGVRKITSKRSSHIELLNLIKFHSVKSSKNYVLTEVEVIDSFEDIKSDLSTVSCVFLLCELIDKLCQVNQRHEDIFELLKETIEKLAVGDRYFLPARHAEFSSASQEIPKQVRSDNGSILFDFQVRLLSLLGFWDQKRKFTDEQDLRQFIESIIERKIKTKLYA